MATDFKCPNCGVPVEADENLIGQETTCPRCDAKMVLGTEPGGSVPSKLPEPCDAGTSRPLGTDKPSTSIPDDWVSAAREREIEAHLASILERITRRLKILNTLEEIWEWWIPGFFLLALPIAGWLGFCLVWDFRWWTGLLIGGFAGFVIAVGAFVGYLWGCHDIPWSVTEPRRRRAWSTAREAFTAAYGASGADYRCAAWLLSKMSSDQDEVAASLGLLNAVQGWRCAGGGSGADAGDTAHGRHLVSMPVADHMRGLAEQFKVITDRKDDALRERW